MNLKTNANHTRINTWEIKKHKEQIAGIIGSLKDYSHAFYGAAQNMMTCTEITCNIMN